MTDNFRKAMLNRLPAMPPPMAPTRAPWAERDEDKDDIEELEGEDTFGDLGASYVHPETYSPLLILQTSLYLQEDPAGSIALVCLGILRPGATSQSTGERYYLQSLFDSSHADQGVQARDIPDLSSWRRI
jgi:hypothetical protein